MAHHGTPSGSSLGKVCGDIRYSRGGDAQKGTKWGEKALEGKKLANKGRKDFRRGVIILRA